MAVVGAYAEAARAVIHGLLGLLVLLAAFVSVFVVTGVISWLDYRKEEVRILDDAVRVGYRRPPTLSNLWRWHEFYLLVLIVIAVAGICWFTAAEIVPLVK